MASSDVNVQIKLTGVDKFKADSQKALGNIDKSSTGFSNLGKLAKFAAKGVLLAGTALVGIGGAALSAAGDFESMRISLKTALGGSQKAADKMFKSLTKFASKTPLQTDEVVRAFVRLKNMGLDPSEKALTSYGDTASAMGKSLMQMVEAVADATTGEFERLKEFGIKAKVEGDKVSFTFKGVKTTVGKNAEEIEQYLLKIGRVNFAGGMEDQSRTLIGLISTFKDNLKIALDDLAVRTGLLDAAKKAISGLSGAIGGLVDPILILKSALEGMGSNTTIQNFISSWNAFVEGFKSGLAPAFASIKTAYETMLKPAIDGMMETFNEIWGNKENAMTFGQILVGVIAGIIIAITTLVTIFVKVWDAMNNVSMFIKNTFTAVVQGITDFFMSLPTTISNVIESIKKFFTDLPSNVGTALALLATAVVNKGLEIIAFIVTLPRRLTDAWDSFKKAAYKAFIDVGLSIYKFIQEAPGKIIMFFGRDLPIAVAKMNTKVSDMFKGLPGMMKNAANGVLSYFEGMINKMIGGWNKIADAPGNPLPHINYVGLPRFAQGGIVGGSSTSGDRVMARVNSGEMILTKGQQGALFSMLKNMSSGNNINFNGGVNFTSNSSPMQQQNNFVNMLMQLQ